MADLSALYPKPPDPGNNALAGDPSRVINLLGGITNLQRSQSELGAKTAIGEAWQRGIRPDGSVDLPAIAQGIGRDPRAAYMAPEAADTLLGQRGKQIANATAQFDQFAKQNQFIADGLGTLANMPNPSMEDVRRFVVTAARNTGVPSSILNGWMASLPRDPAQLKQALSTIGGMAIGSAQGATPDVTGFGPGGEASVGTRGQATQLRQAPAQPQAAPGIVGMRPGQAEAATALATSGAQSANALTTANDTSMVRKGMLGNLEEDLNHFKPGAGSEWELLAKNWANRNVPMPPGWQFDPKSIASQEAFNKQAVQLAQQQFAAIGGTGTDAKFSSAFETSPNQALSKMGNQGIIKLLKGNEDAIQAKNKAWQKWLSSGHGPDTYPQFSLDFNERFDPRVFQFKYLTPKERQDYIERMDENDRDHFLGDLVYAHKQGWAGFEVKGKK